MAKFTLKRLGSSVQSRHLILSRAWAVLLLLLSSHTALLLAQEPPSSPQEAATSRISFSDCGTSLAGLKRLETTPDAEVQGLRNIADGEVQCYKFKLTKNRFIRFAVEQRGVDVLIQLFTADGTPVGDQIDSPNEYDEFEPVSEAAGSDAEYVIAIKSQGSRREPNAGYSIKVMEMGEATDENRSFVSGERALLQGRLNIAAAQNHFLEGNNTDGQNEARKGVDYLEKAQPFLEKANRPYDLRETLNLLGVGYQMLGQADKAIAALSQFLDLSRKTQAPAMEVGALANIATIYAAIGENEKAEVAFKQAVEVKGAAPAMLAQAWVNRGNWYAQNKDILRALDSQEKAAQLYVQGKNFDRAADIYARIGVAYFNRGATSAARDYYMKALAVGAQDPYVLAYTYHNLGVVLTGMDPNEAIKALSAAQKLYGEAQKNPQRKKDELTEATAHLLKSFGLAYANLGDDNMAVGFYRQALALSEPNGEIKFPDAVSYTHLYLGLSLYRLNDRKQSEAETQKALDLFSKAEDKRGQANALVNIGGSFYDAGDKARALELLGRAGPLQREAGDLYGLAYTLTNIGRINLDNGLITEASQVLADALELRRAIGDRTGEGITLYTLALAERRRNNFSKALEYLDAARGIIEDTRRGVTDEDLRASYLATLHRVYELYVDVLVQQGRQTEALEFADNARARVLTEALLTGRFELSAAAGTEGSERRQKLIEELSALLGRKKLLRPEMLKSQSALDLQREIDSRTAELRNLEAELLRGSSLAPVFAPPRLSLEQIKALLDRDTILLEFSLGDESSYLWLVKSEPGQAVLTVPLPGRRKVEKVARRVHELLSDKNISKDNPELQTLSAELSDMLLGKVAQELGGKRIVIVADGSLQYLPFAALPEPGLPARQPLIANHEIVYIPSASALAVLRAPVLTRTPATQAAALFGDPVYELPGGQKPLEQPSRKTERRLDPLNFSRDEIKAIEEAFAKSPSAKGIKTWTDYEATRRNALSPDLLKYKIIHYSAHGVADDERPEAGGLYFTRYDRSGSEIPYFVSLRDIYDMKLASDLVVLSACETALGKDVRGEGLVGLTRGFMHAGSPRVVSTLWRVNQFYTAQLMKSFYNNMLAGKVPPAAAAALRAAQRKMWEQDLSPYLWAGFVFYGDWR